MEKRVSFRHYFYLFFIILGVVAAFDYYFYGNLCENSFNSYSVSRISEDIKIISKEHHSIQHSKERKVVRDFLSQRLQECNGIVEIFNYDSIRCKFGGEYDISNVYASFPSDNVTDSTQYVLLVAHYDSRFFNVVKGDTVYSYGAADDGYGLGVILECVNIASKYRKEWNQGIKVLFTDSEEHELDGMRNAYNNDGDIFKNVNLIINVEARGVKGPVVLFETSNNNSELVNLYKESKNPYGYSITSLIYNMLPNDTDFSVVKDNIAGFNFSVLDNLNYYHTDKDNFNNISLASLSHYGEQILPILKKYLTDPIYSNKDCFIKDKNDIYFTLPIFGLIHFSKFKYLILNIITFIFFFMSLLIIYYKLPFKNLFKRTFKYVIYIFIMLISLFLLGTLIAWLFARVNCVEFNIISIKYANYDSALFIICTLLTIFLSWFLVNRISKKQDGSRHCILSGILIILFILSLLMLIFLGENFIFLIPLLFSSLTILLYPIKYLRFISYFTAFIISILGTSFVFLLYIAITIGSLGIFMVIIFLFSLLLASLYYSYMRNLG
jgi:Predicted aminopeptidases